jgi:hypothetical protein
VSIISERFDEAAELQATRLGLRSIERVKVAHPIQDATDDEMHAKCDDCYEQILASLSAAVAAGATAQSAKL